MVSNLNDEPETPGLSSTSFSIYPNPTTGNFTLVQKGNSIMERVKIEVFTMNGTRMMTETMIGEKSREISVSSLPVGIYVVKIVADDHAETIKLIRTN
jgi:hypothetical protein